MRHGTDKEGSDLDLLVEILSDVTLFDLEGLQVKHEQMLGVPVELVNPDNFRNDIHAKARPVTAVPPT